jgi:hypothetical protein
MQDTATADKLRGLADSLGLIPDEDFGELSGWNEETRRTYRKRGNGPAWVRIGKSVFYLRAGLAAYIAERAQEPRKAPTAGML